MKANSCSNCGRSRPKRWWPGLARQLSFGDAGELVDPTAAPPELPDDPDYRCPRCRPRRDDGSTRLCRTIRDRFGLSQRLWAHVLGVDPRTIERWETGTPEPTGLSLQLLEAFDLAADRNEQVIGLVRQHAREKHCLPELLTDALVLAVGGRQRRRRSSPGLLDGLVSLRVRLSPLERESVSVAAYQSGQSPGVWARGSLVRASVKPAREPLNKDRVIPKVAHG